MARLNLNFLLTLPMSGCQKHHGTETLRCLTDVVFDRSREAELCFLFIIIDVQHLYI